MKILSAEQTQKTDAYTIQHEPISGIDLMERASRQLYFWFHENVSRDLPIYIFCGKGNNGGDGVALSRMLLNAGWDVVTAIVQHSKNSSQDFTTNLQRLKKMSSKIVEVNRLDDIPALPDEAVVVDAILGSGLNQPLRGLIADVVAKLNDGYNAIISIDIPTGLFSNENSNNQLDKVLDANVTLTFQAPFLSFMFPETGRLVGQFEVVDIGLNAEFMEQLESPFFYLTEKAIRHRFKQKQKFTHKGINGHVVYGGGSLGKMGAIVLASKAGLRAGAGLVSAVIPEESMAILQQSAPEAMAESMQTHKVDSNKVYGLGPGLGTSKESEQWLLDTLKQLKTPVVLDADALNILSKTQTWNEVPKNSILTPHLGELARMVGKQKSGEGYLKAAQEFSKQHSLIVVVKGPHTAIVSAEGQVWFNSTGNQGMATGGSGDVLLGIVTSFLGQGYAPLEAAQLGVYFQGKAADLAAEKNGKHGLIAKDIIKYLPQAIKSFEA